MNTLTLTQRRLSARFVAVLTVVSMLLSAFPLAFFTAEATVDEDRRGGPPPSVDICHVPGAVEVLYDIPLPAVLGHLGHGDFVIESEEDLVRCERLVPTTGSITIEKVAGGGDAVEFDFTGDLGAFSLLGNTDTGSDYDELAPDEYTISESDEAGWNLLDITCDSGDWQDAAPAVTINLAVGDDVTCTFTNRPSQDEPDPVATIVATKIVCTDEADLPNDATGSQLAPITSTTAEDWVAAHESCSLEPDWEFQWGPQDAFDPGDTLLGEAGDPWTTVGPTGVDGTVTVELAAADIGDSDHLWFREVLQDGYIPFTHDQNGNTNVDDYTAELYCYNDVLNYDNYDRIDSVAVDETYYCVAWNVPEESGGNGPDYAPYCGDGIVNQEWEQCDNDSDSCTLQCQFAEQNQCTDLTLAKIDIENVENLGAGNMSDDIYLGQGAFPIPNNTWFAVYWNGVFANDPAVLAYEAVPGLAVQRLTGSVRSVMHGSSNAQNEEHADGTVSFWSWDDSVGATAVLNDASGNNTLEGDYTNGSGIGSTNAGDDEIAINGDVAEFWLTTTFQDDGFYTEYSEPVVCDECVDEPDGGWADAVMDYVQADKKDGSSITDVSRTDPTAALGESDWTPGGSTGFFSLGFGGWIEVGFDTFVPNVPGDDISIHEATNGTYPLETALVEVSQTGAVWYELGTADNTAGDKVSYFDIDDAPVALSWIKYVRVTDTSNPALHQNNADGFDLDAIDATQTVCQMPDDPEVPVCEADVNLLANGGFEMPVVAASSYDIFYSGEPLLAWLTGEEGIEIQNNVAGTPYEGSQLAELDPNHPTVIWQEVPTVPGETYRLSTQYSPRPGRDAEDNRFEFRVDGAPLGASIARSGVGNADTDWSYESRQFVATGPTTLVGFAEVGTDTSFGAYLDDAALNCVPEPEPEPIDVCTNIEGDQAALPEGYEFESEGICVPIEQQPEVVLGCTDPAADNYNPEATEDNEDAEQCEYSGVEGESGSSNDKKDKRRSYSSGTRLSQPTPVPQVLGEATSKCGMYLYEYMREGQANNPFEVQKLQLFLNGQGFFIPVTSVFDQATDNAVRAFQLAHQAEVLTPWFLAGYVNHNNSTGWVYQLTRWKVNNIVCPGSEPLPSLIP